ncbi:MAG: hypothetical protein ACFFDI_29395 [Promethearchaeota archaeon]
MLLRFQSRHGFKREYIIAFALLLNTFSWYFVSQLMVTRIGNVFDNACFENLCLELAYPISIIASAFVGSVLLARARKIPFFYVWLLLGVFASLCLAIPVGSSLSAWLILISILGASLGLGMPLCLSYFTELVPIENRGKVGGIILFATTFTAPLGLIAMDVMDLMLSAVFLALLRAWSLPLLFLTSEKNVPSEMNVKKSPSISSVLYNRTFSLYFVAWLMFALVDSFGGVIVDLNIGEFQFFIGIVEPIITGFSALIGGVISDWVGRKRVLIFGFVSLGMAYATIGFLWETLPVSWFFYFIIDGIALGLLWVILTIVLWGEVGRYATEKYYAVGEAPFFLTQILYLLLAPYIALIPEYGVFSLAAFFLFIAVIPLLYARETLPEKKIQQRQLKIYTKEALKLKQKIEQK